MSLYHTNSGEVLLRELSLQVTWYDNRPLVMNELYSRVIASRYIRGYNEFRFWMGNTLQIIPIDEND